MWQEGWENSGAGPPQGSPPGRLPAPPQPTPLLCPLQFNNMLLYCVPRVIQVGAQFQVRTRIDVAGMKVRGAPTTVGHHRKRGPKYGELQEVPTWVLHPGTQAGLEPVWTGKGEG